jgi:hypothetical protein
MRSSSSSSSSPPLASLALALAVVLATLIATSSASSASSASASSVSSQSSGASAFAPVLTRAGFGALDGAASVAELVERARAAGLLRVTDNATSCVWWVSLDKQI